MEGEKKLKFHERNVTKFVSEFTYLELINRQMMNLKLHHVHIQLEMI